MSQVTIEQIRQEFPVTQVCSYLDTAYTGPLPQRSVRAITELVESKSRKPFPVGRDERTALLDRLRGKVARLLGVSPEEILFTRSTTDGLHMVATALLKPGDELLVGGLDHPADYAIWAHLANKGIKVTLVPHWSRTMVAEDFAKAIGPRTKGIGICLVNTYNGYRQDLESLSKLCQEHGLYLLLDGIQAVGHLDIDLKSNKVTMLTAGVYKWLCSPEGAGVAYLNKEVIERILPPIVSVLYVNPADEDNWGSYIRRVFQYGEEHAGAQPIRANSLKYDPTAKRLELKPGLLSLVGLEAMVDLLMEFGGMETVEHRVLALTAHLRASVQEYGHQVLSDPSPRVSSGITSVRVPDAQKFAAYAEERGIYVLPQLSPTPGAQAVRVSTHIFNSEEDIAALTEALDDFARQPG